MAFDGKVNGLFRGAIMESGSVSIFVYKCFFQVAALTISASPYP